MSVHDRPDWMMDECWVEAQPTFKDAGKNRSRDGQGHASKSEERLYLKKVFIILKEIWDNVNLLILLINRVSCDLSAAPDGTASLKRSVSVFYSAFSLE